MTCKIWVSYQKVQGMERMEVKKLLISLLACGGGGGEKGRGMAGWATEMLGESLICTILCRAGREGEESSGSGEGATLWHFNDGE